jgi:fibronectin-binding autotransporter adhesin
MAIAVAQQVSNPAAGSSLSVAAGTTQTVTATLSAGSTVIILARGEGAARTVTCSGATDGSLTTLDTGDDGNAQWTTFAKQNVSAGSQVFTATWPNSNSNRGLILIEITGATTTGGVQAHVMGTTANTSPSMTVGTAPAMIVGFGCCENGDTIAADTGAGFTAGTACWRSSNDGHMPEWQRVTSTGSYAATFTGGTGGDRYVGIAVTEAATGLTLALTGVAATAAVGTLGPGLSKALTGNASTAAVGTVAPGISKAITGNAATAAVGALSPSLTIPLTGNAATGAAGTVTVSGSNVTLALTGVAATGAAGALGPSLSLGLTGAAASSAVGTVGPALSMALTGTAATASVGTVAPGTSRSLTGVASAAAVGSLALSMSIPLTGAAAAGAVGSVATSGGTPTAAVALSRWKLDETSGTTLADSIGSNTLTIGSGVTLNVTPPAVLTSSTGAARGTTGCIGAKASATGLPNGTASQSWSLWIKAVSNTPAQAVFSLTNAAVTAGAGLVVSAGSILILEYSGAATVVSATAPSTGNWHHVAWTYDATSTTSLLYVDGTQVGSATGGLVTSTTADVILGTTDSGTTSPFAGDVDDVRVFSGVLTAAQITRMAAGGEPNDTTLALTGVAATGAAGTVGPARAVALTGAASSSAVGSLGVGMSVVLTGAAATGAAGTIGPGRSVGITGVGASSAVGSVTPAISIVLTGASAVGQLGTIGVNGNLTIALTGVSSTGAAGTVGPGRSVPVSGVALAGAVGSLGVAISRALTGVGATGIVGNLTIPVPLVPLFPPFVAEVGSVQLTAESTGDTLTVTGDT